MDTPGLAFDKIKERIIALSGIGETDIDEGSVMFVAQLVADQVLALTNREKLNDPLARVCIDLAALNWMHQYFLSDDDGEGLLLGGVLSISEGDTRIAYQNRSQIDGEGADYGAYGYLVENAYAVIRRYRRLHWGSSKDEDYG